MECTDAATVIEKIVYTMVNPVKDGLVAHGKNWPGVRRCWPAKPKVVRRPDGFFRGEDDGGSWPETATLRFTRPPGFDHLTDDELGAKIRDAIEAEEASCRAQAQREGRRFIGRRAILRTSRYAYAQSWRKQFGLVPTIAGKTAPRLEAIERLRAFRADHAEALAAYRAGDCDVAFPYGTWKMRRYYGAHCRPPP